VATLLACAQGWPMRAQVKMLPDGRRMHLHDGPIDIVLQAFGAPAEICVAYDAAVSRFSSVLDELCAELPILRTPAPFDARLLQGVVARRMLLAVSPYALDHFITPMAAVAGAVAEEILLAMTSVSNLRRAYVNDGGDIALHLAPGERFSVGMVDYAVWKHKSRDRRTEDSLFGTLVLDSSEPVRGIATSGWRGRSFSLGIADAVTVLAASAAMADTAATIIANSVDLPGHPAILRVPARDLDPQSDLVDRLVTRDVGFLTHAETVAALDRGLRMAESLQRRGLIHSAALHLRGETRAIIQSGTTFHDEPIRRLAYA
jgi:ApbE superfamily uncharacterized protein (UPF0280 family)